MSGWNAARRLAWGGGERATVHSLCLEGPAQQWPHHLALTCGRKEMTFRELDQAAEEVIS
jgi:non-ribosomal peptide synthetase component E (peptide arylation enzyme)